jgi:regulator of replication initiation timing
VLTNPLLKEKFASTWVNNHVEENTFLALENDKLLLVSNNPRGCRSIQKTKKSEETTCELSATENAR